MHIQDSTTLQSSIKDLICVTKPYFNLRQLEQVSEKMITCKVPVENETSGEFNIISAAEAGRHLAILGSCIVALNNPIKERHFYLATKAHIKSTKHIKPAKTNTRAILFAQAELLSFNKRNATVKCELFSFNKDLVYSLDVQYQVMKKALFEKFFNKHFIDENPNPRFNPYSKTAIITDIQYEGKTLEGYFGIVSNTQCVGHFDNYPALPIAILCSALAKTGGIHLTKILKDESLKFYTKDSKIKAHRLAFAGEEIFIKSAYIEENNKEYIFNVKAFNRQSEDIGEIGLTLALVD